MTSANRIGAVIVCVCCTLAATSGCYDTDPRDVDQSQSPALPADADACETCAYEQVEGMADDCQAEHDACAPTANCLNIMRCIYQAGCYEGDSLKDSITCGTPCALRLGAQSADDPQVRAGLAVSACVIRACASACK